MRSNQERVAEVFKRAEAYRAHTMEQRNVSSHSKWSQPWVRVVASLLVVVLLFGTGVGLFFGLKDRTHGISNFDKMYIANFANYKAIGAAGVDTTAEQILQPQSLNVMATNSNERLYLVGVDKNNNIERCRTSRKNRQAQDDESYEIDYQIERIYAFERYTFVSFVPTTWVVGNPEYQNYRCESSYVIDNLTGKFYSLDVFGKSAILYLGYDPNTYSAYGYDGLVSDDGVFVTVNREAMTSINSTGSIYKVYVKDDKLVLEEMFDYSLNLGVGRYFVDKFNNIYLRDASDTVYNFSSLPTYRINYLVSNGKLIKPTEIGLDADTGIFRSLNGICYTADRTKFFNANGELVDNDFDDCGYFFKKAEKVKTVGNVDYYFKTETKWELFKVTWADEVKFSTEKIEFSRPVEIKGYVSTQDYIYIIEENEVSKIEITTGNIEPLTSDYTFTSIQADYLGNVIFNGNDAYMNRIVGIITNDGEISIITKPREYQIYYIAPVN